MSVEPAFDEAHEAKIKTILKLPEAIAIPDQTVELYWRVKRAADRIGTQLTDMDLVWITIESGAHVPPQPPPDFSAFADGVEYGQAVEAKWKFGRWKSGVYHGCAANGHYIVQLDDGTGEDREFAPSCVRLIDG
jgi:hypothetical protein